MSDYMYLSGSEDVLNAGNRMKEAAGEMTRAASFIGDSMVQFREQVDRLEQLVVELLHPPEET